MRGGTGIARRGAQEWAFRRGKWESFLDGGRV